MNLTAFLQWLLSSLPSIVVTVIITTLAVAWGIVRYYDKFELIQGRLARWFAWFSKRAERATVALDLQSRCETLAKTINSEVPGALAYGLKVEWARETSPEAFVQEGHVVLRLDHHRNQARNVMVAVMTYLPKALIPQARSYTHPVPLKGLDLTVARKVIAPYGTEALTYFIHEALEPAFTESNEVRASCADLEALDDRGLLFRVLVRELLQVGTALFPRAPSDEVRNETKEFVDFLSTIAKRERGQDVPLKFQGRHISVGLVLVARREIYHAYGVTAYTRRIMTLVRQGVRNVYVGGWGHNVSTVREVVRSLQGLTGLDAVSEAYHRIKNDDTTWKAVLVLLRNNVALDAPGVRQLEAKLSSLFLSYLIKDLIVLEERTGIADLSQLHGLIASNVYYDPSTYQRPDRAAEELLRLGILVANESGAGYRVVRENQYVRAALAYS